MSSDYSELPILPAPPAQQAEALWLLLRDCPSLHRAKQAEAILSAARAGAVSLDALMIATHDDRIRGVAWANPVPGGLGGMWPPQLAQDFDSNDQLAQRLIAAAEQTLLRSARIVLWQASIRVDDLAASRRLRAAGYRPLTMLIHLLAAPDLTDADPHDEAIQWERYQARDLDRLCRVIDASYVDSLDCPELDRLRSTADCVAGYRAIGNSGEEYWYFVRHAGRDIGCLLLAGHDSGPGELIYMGLGKPYRGRGLGRLLVAKALEVGRSLGEAGLITSVDNRNLPGLKAYRAAGFREWERRQILIKSA